MLPGAAPPAADDARAKPHQPKLVDIDTECRNQKATAPAEGGDHAGSAWPHPLQPAAPAGGGGWAGEREEQGVKPAGMELAPVATRGEERRQRARRLLAERGRGGRGFGERRGGRAPDRGRARRPLAR